ncbi:hypothetical protein [Thermoanaerobacter thermocopriae]|nr:hypothetical protein [Thermoanaerobacter thermocopriae]
MGLSKTSLERGGEDVFIDFSKFFDAEQINVENMVETEMIEVIVEPK